MTQIHENSAITLNFALRLEDGQLIDSTFETQPAAMHIGDGSLPPGFEKHILGLSVGDHRKVTVPPEDAFGQVNPGNRQIFDAKQFAQSGELSPGVVVSFQDAAGSELPGVIAEVNDEKVMVDFNHPLAGKTLEFEVEIISVEAKQNGH